MAKRFLVLVYKLFTQVMNVPYYYLLTCIRKTIKSDLSLFVLVKVKKEKFFPIFKEN